MKGFAFVCLFVVVAAGRVPFNPELDRHWENFKTTFNKNYKGNEEIGRRLVWEQHVASIARHNLDFDLGKISYRLGLNEYSDLTNKEFVQRMNGLKRRVNGTSTAAMTFTRLSHLRLPDTVDWRKEGYVTGVKNQEQCGSCWAFSTTGSLEGQHFKKTGKLVSLSEQNLVDCSRPEGNQGCEGGLMDQGFEYIKKNRGIDTEASYPYEAVDDTCRFKRQDVGATCTGYVDVTSGDEEALKQAAATIGPVSVAIDASSFNFQLYSGGVYDEQDCSTVQLDHGVLVVGYGTTEDGVDYWLVKNSWGSSWGLDGYIKMSRNKNNQCGIATQASYPLV